MAEDETTELPGAGDAPAQDETRLLSNPSDEHTVMLQVERAWLLCIGGPLTGKKFPVRLDTTKIGRSKAYNDIALEGDLMASKRHATVICRGARYFIQDKRSRNRTYVNRRKLGEDEEFALNFGDEMEVGSAIFRFVREDQWDWRPPLKAGSFWARRGRLVLLVASVIVALGAGLVGLSAARYVALAKARPARLELTLLKSADLGAEAGSVSSSYHYAPAVVWLPGLGCCGIAVAGTDRRLVIANGRDLTVRPQSTGDDIDPTQAIITVDVDGDGADELVVVTKQGGVAALNPQSGFSIWSSGFLHRELLAPVAGDCDGDGLPDIVVAGTDGSIFRRGSASGGDFEKLGATGGALDAPPMLTDLDGDGKTEIVVVDNRGRTTVLDANSGAVEVDTAYPNTGLANIGYAGTPQVYAPPAAAAVPGKSTRMMVFTDLNDALTVTSHGAPTESGFAWAQRLYDELRTKFEQLSLVGTQRYPAPLVADLKRDGYPDIVVATIFGPLAALDGRTGAVLWACFDSSRWDAIHATPALFDFDRDGVDDVVFADNRGGVHVVSGANGQLLAETQPDTVPVYASPLIADANGDGKADIVVENAAGTVFVIGSNCPVPERRTFWPMEGGVATGEHVARFAGFRVRQQSTQMGAAGVVILVLLAANLILALVHAGRKRRLRQISAD